MPRTDEQLATIISARDESSPALLLPAHDACRELYQRHARPLLAFLASRVRRGDLDDVHQAVWERIWRYLPRGFDGRNFRALLYKVARSCVIDTARKKRPDQLPDGHDPPAPNSGVSGDPLQEPERLATLQRCLERLAAQAARLVRARLAGDDYETICRELGLQPAQAHKLFHTAKTQLHDCLTRSKA
jgi:RNA polymerase sigma factor (sigma-70 family)